jgi:hypothetical protein
MHKYSQTEQLSFHGMTNKLKDKWISNKCFDFKENKLNLPLII